MGWERVGEESGGRQGGEGEGGVNLSGLHQILSPLFATLLTLFTLVPTKWPVSV